MNIKTRIEKLEEEMQPQDKETIVYVQNYAGAFKPQKGKAPCPASKLPAPETEIARQRAEGKKLIVVSIPYGYVLNKEEEHTL